MTRSEQAPCSLSAPSDVRQAANTLNPSPVNIHHQWPSYNHTGLLGVRKSKLHTGLLGVRKSKLHTGLLGVRKSQLHIGLLGVNKASDLLSINRCP